MNSDSGVVPCSLAEAHRGHLFCWRSELAEVLSEIVHGQTESCMTLFRVQGLGYARTSGKKRYCPGRSMLDIPGVFGGSGDAGTLNPKPFRV